MVIILSNGMLAIHNAMYDRFGSGKGTGGGALDSVLLVLGTTTHGSCRNHPSGEEGEDRDHGNIFVWNYGITHTKIGLTSCADAKFIDACRLIGWDARHCVPRGEMDAILWRKPTTNCMINPLMVISGVRNGGLLDAMAARQGGGAQRSHQ